MEISKDNLASYIVREKNLAGNFLEQRNLQGIPLISQNNWLVLYNIWSMIADRRPLFPSLPSVSIQVLGNLVSTEIWLVKIQPLKLKII